MTDTAPKAPKIETCRWSLTLGIGLLAASFAVAGVMIPRLAGRSPLTRPPTSSPVPEPSRLPPTSSTIPENGGIATEIQASK